MRISNTNIFEKLNIKQIHLDLLNEIDIPDSVLFKKYPENPCFYEISKNAIDLKPGYLVKTSNEFGVSSATSICIFFDDIHMNIFDSYASIPQKEYGAFVRYNKDIDSNVSYIRLSNYFGCWPKHNIKPYLDIVSVYETNINLDIFKTKSDIVEFYLENNLV